MGELKKVLSNRPDIRIVGDRFVFQSEVFFDTGQAVLLPEGRAELDKVAQALLEIGKRIPLVKDIGGAAIFATFIPSFLAFHAWVPPVIVQSVTDFTKNTNFLYLFISCIIVGSILSMDRTVLIRGFLKIFVPLAAGSVAAALVV